MSSGAVACVNCGASLPDGARFCGQCGKVVDGPQAPAGAPPAAPKRVGVGTMIAFAPNEAAPATLQDPPATGPAYAPTPPAGLPAQSPNAYSLEQPPVPAPAVKVAAKTMLGVASADVLAARVQALAGFSPPAPPPHQGGPSLASTLPSTPPPPVPAPAGAPAPAPAQRFAGAQTMIGVSGVSPYAATPAAPPVHVGNQPSTAPEIPAARARTLLGVTSPSAGVPSTGAGPSTLASPGVIDPRQGGTMLGVAMPGIAPLSAGAAPVGLSQANAEANARKAVRGKLANTALSDMPVLPAPAPYVDDVAMPDAPRVRAKKGVPLTVVAALIGGLVLLGGGVILLLYRGAPPLTAKPQLDAQDNEVLHLQCENCADGTTASLNGAKATFKAAQADLALAVPLKVGSNDVTVTLDRPGTGRDEQVKLVVPLAFRIRADLSQIDAKPPTIVVRVGAAPGSNVVVDKKPLALDGAGNGSYAIDVSADTEGTTEDVRLIDRHIDYTIEPSTKGSTASSGQVTARVAIVPLRVDAPSAHAIVDGASFTIAGQTIAGGTVTIDGQPATVQPDGSFAATHAATTDTASIEIRAGAATHAPRTAHITVKRGGNLEADAKAAEQSSPPLLTYDQIAPDIASKVGQRAVIAGEVAEAPHVAGHQAIVLVNDVRACKAGPCLARVIASEDVKLTRGQSVRAYGTVTRAVTTSTGKTVPELQADFVARGSGPRDKSAK